VKVKKGDTIEVIAGDDRGKRGTVHQILPNEDRVIVSGIHLIKRHQRPTGQARQVGIIEREAPLHLSNVAVVCNHCDRPARVGYKVLADGSKVRICRRCGEIIEPKK
jgi:large subunit ribosomal protein L24